MKELRKEIEPRLDIAEQRYPEVLKLIMDYTDYCDENGDEENIEYEKLEERLHRLTGKDMSRFNLWEWWEEEGAEVLSFRISLPDPIRVEGITKEELTEITRRLKTFVKGDDDDESFKGQFHYHMNDYYHDFLAVNFKSYEMDLFHSHKDKNGNYYEFTTDEIVEKILDNGK